MSPDGKEFSKWKMEESERKLPKVEKKEEEEEEEEAVGRKRSKRAAGRTAKKRKVEQESEDEEVKEEEKKKLPVDISPTLEFLLHQETEDILPSLNYHLTRGSPLSFAMNARRYHNYNALKNDTRLKSFYYQLVPNFEQRDIEHIIFASCQRFIGYTEASRYVHAAIKLRDPLLLDLALANGDADYRAHDGKSFLFEAIGKGVRMIVERLVEIHSLPVNDEPGDLMTPLHYSVSLNDERITCKSICFPVNSSAYLLSKGANPNVTNYVGDSPLILAIRANRWNLVQLLVSHGASVKELYFPPYEIIIVNEDGERLEDEMDEDVEGEIDTSEVDNDEGKSVLRELIEHSPSTKILEFLLSHGADTQVTFEGNNNIFHILASYWNEPKAFDLLVENVKDQKTIEKLLNQVNSEGQTPLFTAAVKFKPQLLSRMFKVPNVNLKASIPAYFEDKEGNRTVPADAGLSLIHKLAKNGYLQQVKELVNLGVDPNVKTIVDPTPPLLLSAHPLEFLALPSVDPNITDHRGRNLLHYLFRAPGGIPASFTHQRQLRSSQVSTSSSLRAQLAPKRL